VAFLHVSIGNLHTSWHPGYCAVSYLHTIVSNLHVPAGIFLHEIFAASDETQNTNLPSKGTHLQTTTQTHLQNCKSKKSTELFSTSEHVQGQTHMHFVIMTWWHLPMTEPYSVMKHTALHTREQLFLQQTFLQALWPAYLLWWPKEQVYSEWETISNYLSDSGTLTRSSQCSLERSKVRPTNTHPSNLSPFPAHFLMSQFTSHTWSALKQHGEQVYT